jgi:hypothetical protein
MQQELSLAIQEKGALNAELEAKLASTEAAALKFQVHFIAK